MATFDFEGKSSDRSNDLVSMIIEHNS